MNAVDELAEWFDAVEATGVRIKRIRLNHAQWWTLYSDLDVETYPGSPADEYDVMRFRNALVLRWPGRGEDHG